MTPPLRILADDRLASVDFAIDPLTLERIKGSSFFNTEQFPTIVFVGNHFI